jgi:Arm DNA-binding domain
MAKNLTGYVRFDQTRKRWFFRCAPVDPKTGLRKERKEYFLTQREAEQARRKFLTELDQNGDAVFSREDLTFEQLALRYREARLIPAEYIDGKKVAGHRVLSPLTAYLKSLTEYFGKQRIRKIQFSDLESLKLHVFRYFRVLRRFSSHHVVNSPNRKRRCTQKREARLLLIVCAEDIAAHLQAMWNRDDKNRTHSLPNRFLARGRSGAAIRNRNGEDL